MKHPPQQPIEPDDDSPIDPLVFKAHLYHILSRLWFFPSLGAILILGRSALSGSFKEIIDSQRLEDIAAAAVLLGHVFLFLQARRFHLLKLSREDASLPH